MNLFSTSAGIVLIGLMTLSVTRPAPERAAPELELRVALGVYDERALPLACAHPEELPAWLVDALPGIAREADVEAIVSRQALDHHAPAVVLVDVTARVLERLPAREGSPGPGESSPR